MEGMHNCRELDTITYDSVKTFLGVVEDDVISLSDLEDAIKGILGIDREFTEDESNKIMDMYINGGEVEVAYDSTTGAEITENVRENFLAVTTDSIETNYGEVNVDEILNKLQDKIIKVSFEKGKPLDGLELAEIVNSIGLDFNELNDGDLQQIYNDATDTLDSELTEVANYGVVVGCYGSPIEGYLVYCKYSYKKLSMYDIQKMIISGHTTIGNPDTPKNQLKATFTGETKKVKLDTNINSSIFKNRVIGV